MVRSILLKAHYIPLALLFLYPVLLFLLTIPWLQRQFIFLHWVQWPIGADYDNPERYGLAPFKTRNFKLNTSDGESLGVWHILPRATYQTLEPFPPRHPLGSDLFEQSLRDRPTIIYFHGNAANRAAPHRIKSYVAYSALNVNVLAIDYRGFGDSTGEPSEEGLLKDARAVWDYASTFSDAAEVVLAGQSLGTGVVAGLAGELAEQGISPRAIVMIAPFTSITDLLDSFWLFGFIPLLSPLKSIPFALEYFKRYIAYPFNSTAALAKTNSPILLLHAKNDDVIPHHHSSTLFAGLHERCATTSGIRSDVEVVEFNCWGTVSSFPRSYTMSSGGDTVQSAEMVWWDGLRGGHNDIGWSEGTVDLIRRIARL